jgi:hypothetical protein
MWFLGDIANVILVKAQLRQIFGHRFTAVEAKFGKWPNDINELIFG